MSRQNIPLPILPLYCQKLHSTAGTRFKTLCIQNDLHLLDASVRHLGTDINYIVLENLYNHLKNKVDFFFDTPVEAVKIIVGGYSVTCKDAAYTCENCIISVVIVQRFGDLIRNMAETGSVTFRKQ